MEELTARVEAHLRWDERNRNVSRIMASNELFVGCSQIVVLYKEKEIVFPKKEFDIIEFLLQNTNQVFDKEHIYDEVWGLGIN